MLWDNSEEQNVIRRAFEHATAPLLQTQDLSNEWAEAFARANVELDVPYEKYRDGVTRADVVLNGSSGGESPRFRLYNPAGAILRWINGGEYSKYSKRVVDIEGVRRAALLTSELRSRGIAAAQIPAELSASATRDPYTEGPLGWNAQKSALTFKGLESSPRGLHEFVF